MSDEIRAKVKETAYQIIEDKGYVISAEVAKIVGIPITSSGQYLKHNFREWGLCQKEFGKDLSQRRWAYAKNPGKIPYFKHERTGGEARKELELKEMRLRKFKIQARAKEAISQAYKRAAEIRSKAEQGQKETPDEKIDRIIIEVHKEKGKANFNDIRDKAKSYFGKKGEKELLHDELDHYKKFIKRKELKVDENGFTYLPS